jgi:3-phosphoinositide dependent protein kinase-1
MEKCANCEAVNETPMLCGGCKSVSYCNRDCQKSHWKTHKTQCNFESKPNEEKVETLVDKSSESKENTISNEGGNSTSTQTKTLQFEDYLEKLEKEEMEKPEVAKRIASFNRIKDFEMLEEIGQGNFTTLYKVIDKKTDKEYALKVAEKAKVVRMHKETDLVVEKHCLSKLKDVHSVVKLEETFQDSQNVYILLELIKGTELWHLVNTFGLPNKAKAFDYFSQILEAVGEIHTRGIVHRDLKPENVMVSSDNDKIKLIDFGSAKDIVENVASKGNSSTGRVYFAHFMGTPNYMAPECIHNKASEMPSDIYSLGCILYNLLVGFPPFLGGSDYLIFTAGLQKRIAFYSCMFVSEEIELINKMLDHEIDKRPTIAEVIEKFSSLKFQVLEKEKEWLKMSSTILEEFISKIRKSEKMEEKEIEMEVEAVWEQLKASDKNAEFEKRISDRVELLKFQALHHYKFKTFEHKYLKTLEDQEQIVEEKTEETKET